MNKEAQTLDLLKNETLILKFFSNKPKEEDYIYDKLFETLDVIIQGQH